MSIQELYQKLDEVSEVEFQGTFWEPVRLALTFAAAAHAAVGQKRKYTGAPYLDHPIEVAKILRIVMGNDVSEDQLSSAYLHDVLEDTQVTFDYLSRWFGYDVARMVLELSDVSKPSDGNRATRKKIDLEHYAKISKEAADVKLADLISNTRSIVEHDKEFARVYVKEKEALLGVLQHADPRMVDMANQALKLAKQHLGE